MSASTAVLPAPDERVRGWEDGWRPRTDPPCKWCGIRDDTLVELSGCGDDLIHRVHHDCRLAVGRRWWSEPDPSAPPRVQPGQVEATITRGLNLIWAHAYATSSVFTAAAWRKAAEQQNVPTDLMAIAAHRAIRREWIEALDLVDGRVDLELYDRRQTRFVSRIYRPRRGGRR